MPIRGREIGVVGRDHEVAGVHQRQAEAGHRALHAPDDRVRHPVQMLDRRVQATDCLPEAIAADGRGFGQALGERPDVAAGHEMPAGPAQHDDAQAVVGGDARRVSDERIDHRGIERVERVGPIERQRRDRTVACQQYGVVHRRSS
jgi:hypothetical protein